ncbi:MAG: toprim domain-containing protein, partial [Oscillospiraceae bacterium]|nr:toprim domain-containing protein [Oscillospiraceae bacterium]
YAEEVVISYDSDAAGQNATVKAVNLLRAVGLRPRILHMHDAKDPDEYIKKFGPAYFRKLLEEADDAVTYELQRCRDGTDAATEDGAITALHKAVGVLAGIENELDRNVYLSKLAKDYEIPTEVLKAQVEQEIRKRRKNEKKQSWTALKSAPMLPDPVNPEATAKRQEAKAEEQILCYLFRQPDALEDVMKQIRPEDFATELNRRIFQHLADKLRQGYTYDLSLFSDSFTPDEMSRITGIEVMHAELDISPKAVQDCIRILKAQKLAPAQAADMNNDDWQARMQSLAKQKRS